MPVFFTLVAYANMSSELEHIQSDFVGYGTPVEIVANGKKYREKIVKTCSIKLLC